MWKINRKKNTLETLSGIEIAGEWKFDIHPGQSQIINMQDTSKGFGVENDATTPGSKVNIDETLSVMDLGQMWHEEQIGAWEKGYYIFRNYNALLILCATTPEDLTIEGEYLLYTQFIYSVFGQNRNNLAIPSIYNGLYYSHDKFQFRVEAQPRIEI